MLGLGVGKLTLFTGQVNQEMKPWLPPLSMGITVAFSYHAAERQTQFLAQSLTQLRDFTVSVAAVATVSLSLFCRGQHLAVQREISKAEDCSE